MPIRATPSCACPPGTKRWAFQSRLETGGTTYNQSGPTGAVPGWVRLVREGNLFSAYRSTNGTSWSLLGTDTINMSSTVYVGLAVTSKNNSSTSTATFTNVTARTATAGGSNQPPTVSITGPSAGATFASPATFVVTASASDTDGTVSKVDLYQGTQMLKSDVTSPYSVSVTISTAGTYQLSAIATDSDGDSTTSAPVSVTVTSASTNQPPSVSLTAPAGGSSFTAPASMTVSASASDSDGTVSRVDFYRGSTPDWVGFIESLQHELDERRRGHLLADSYCSSMMMARLARRRPCRSRSTLRPTSSRTCR